MCLWLGPLAGCSQLRRRNVSLEPAALRSGCGFLSMARYPNGATAYPDTLFLEGRHFVSNVLSKPRVSSEVQQPGNSMSRSHLRRRCSRAILKSNVAGGTTQFGGGIVCSTVVDGYWQIVIQESEGRPSREERPPPRSDPNYLGLSLDRFHNRGFALLFRRGHGFKFARDGAASDLERDCLAHCFLLSGPILALAVAWSAGRSC
jgi:hypothetical protein